jgi:hypothetical protein
VRIGHYLANRSLFWDEAGLVLNLVDHSYAELLTKLDYDQVAPLGFLAMSKSLFALFGTSELGLRILPLTFGVLAVLLFATLARRVLPPIAAALALALFVLSRALVQYASEFKPYSLDVALTIAIVLAAIVGLERHRRGGSLRAFALVSATAGAVIVWFSNAVVFVLAAAGFAYLYELGLRERSCSRAVAVAGVCLVWFVSFMAAYFLYLQDMSGDPYFRDFYRARAAYLNAPEGGAFLPLPTSVVELKHAARWLIHTDLDMFNDPLGFYFVGVAILAFVVGAAVLIMRRTELAILLLMPSVVALVASAIQAYPFYRRFLLFLSPLEFIVIAAGAHAIVAGLGDARPVGAATIAALLLLNPYAPLDVLRRPISRVEMRPALEYVAEQRAGTDFVYFPYGAEPVVKYYGPRFRLDDDRVLLGAGAVHEATSPEKTRAIVADLERLRGVERAWIVLSYIAAEEKEAILARLRELGRVEAKYTARYIEVYRLGNPSA